MGRTVLLASVLLVFAAVFLVVVAIFLLGRRPKTALDERLESLSRREIPGRRQPASLIREGEKRGFGRFLGVLSGVFPESFLGEDVRLRLVRAGHSWRETLPILVGFRFLGAVVVGATAVVLGFRYLGAAPQVLLIGAAALVAGFLLPDFILWIRIGKRQEEIVLGLPDALDLMVICVEAGLGLNAAIHRVGTEIEHVCPPLSKELRMVNREMLAGSSRSDALQNLALRTGIEDIKALVAILIQTERLGTSVAKSLRIHADNLRVRRRHRAEERARKVAVKLVFPLILFIFPTLLLVILGPGMIQLIRALSEAQ
ncbi:MAG: type II secretion system F family protein [Candidatus Eisenbacteria bacterium]|nr:type II secretion system F family protein [Candidatus Eisenbacteria bacterium]